MTDETAARLLGAINCDESRLAIFFGAGLSMGAPSRVPNASDLLQICVRRYEAKAGVELHPQQKASLEHFASYLWSQNQLKSFLIPELVPWERFRWMHNAGHEAVADLLLSRAFDFALTTNFDTLVEDSVPSLGRTHFRAAVEAASVMRRGRRYHNPLLKVHGCCAIAEHQTIWCEEQLDEEPIADRLRQLTPWLETNLPFREVIVLGFWTDWDYLNVIFERSLTFLEPDDVITLFVVNPATEEDLRRQAPDLFGWCDETDQVEFIHIPECGEPFLIELRNRVSRNFYARASPAGRTRPLPPEMSNDALYSIRQCLCGCGPAEVVSVKDPPPGSAAVVEFENWLLSLGAVPIGSCLRLNETVIRVVNAEGRRIGRYREEFRITDRSTIGVDITVYISGADDGVPSHVIRGTSQASVARSRDTSEWIDHETATQRFGGE